MLEHQLIQKSLENSIIPFAMEILEELNIYCEEIQIKKVTAYLKHSFGKGKHLEKKQVKYLLPHSDKIKAPTLLRSGGSQQKYMIQQ